MRKLLAFTLSIILLGAAGCAANTATNAPTASATPSAITSAGASATPAKQWTKEETIDRYLKTENGKTTVKADAIKADYTQFQVTSTDTAFNLKVTTYDKISPLLDKLATVQMTEEDSSKLTETPENQWSLQSYTAAGKVNGDSVTIRCTMDNKIDLFILTGGQTVHKVFTITDTDSTALRAVAKEQSRVANNGQ